MVNKSKLYWCADPRDPTGTILDLKHPVCRESCPTGPTKVIINGSAPVPSVYSCFDAAVVGEPVPIPNAGPGSYTRPTSYYFKEVTDYATKPVLTAYCWPQDNNLVKQITSYFNKNIGTKILFEAASIKNAWPVFIAAVVMAVILGFLYLWLIEKCARCLVYTSLVILIVLPLVMAGIMIYAYFKGGLDGIPSTGDKTYDLMIGIGCIIASLLFAVLACCCHAALDTAIRVVQATSECMMDMPSLLMEPLISNFFRLIVLCGLMAGFVWLLSCGKISTVSLDAYVALPQAQVSGVFRSFRYSETEWYYILYYVFMIFWVMELFTACSQFALAYAVQLWYFTPYVDHDKDDVPCCPVIWGFLVGGTFHLGSLAFGSFIIAVTRLIRVILGFIAKQARSQDNYAVECCAKILMGCVSCFQRCMEFLNKNAYMDIAINSTSFCYAAWNAMTIIFKNFPTIALLNGACWVFQLAGVGSITGLGTYFTYLLICHVSVFTDPSGVHYVMDKVAVLVVAGCLCFMVSYAFMLVYDTVADTILYCKCNEEIMRAKGDLHPATQYAPPALDACIQGRDHSDSDSN